MKSNERIRAELAGSVAFQRPIDRASPRKLLKDLKIFFGLKISQSQDCDEKREHITFYVC